MNLLLLMLWQVFDTNACNSTQNYIYDSTQNAQNDWRLHRLHQYAKTSIVILRLSQSVLFSMHVPITFKYTYLQKGKLRSRVLNWRLYYINVGDVRGCGSASKVPTQRDSVPICLAWTCYLGISDEDRVRYMIPTNSKSEDVDWKIKSRDEQSQFVSWAVKKICIQRKVEG